MVTVWTVGHSTRSGEEFVQILLAHEIQVLVDVRSFPGSRRYPQFNRAALAESLQQAGIEYRHEPRLGGRRTPRKDSHNTAWKNASFRAYADHMESEELKTEPVAPIPSLPDTAPEHDAVLLSPLSAPDTHTPGGSRELERLSKPRPMAVKIRVKAKFKD